MRVNFSGTKHDLMNLLEGIIPFVNEAWLACGSLIIVVICMNPQSDWMLFFFYTKFDECVPFDHSKGQCSRITRRTQGPLEEFKH